jgi:hypothetical protein
MSDPRIKLPELTSTPTFHPDCCLSLSTSTLRTISDHLPQYHGLVLSIGSGSGLLEQLLNASNPHLHVQGVEVHHSVNKYLPEQSINIVKGTWELCSRAAECDAAMFVYPRASTLVARYLEEFAVSSRVQTVLWIGTAVDWQDFRPVFEASAFDNLHECQLSASENMTVARRDGRY